MLDTDVPRQLCIVVIIIAIGRKNPHVMEGSKKFDVWSMTCALSVLDCRVTKTPTFILQ